MMEQLSLFPELEKDNRLPITLNWNLWHGCTKVSAGCAHCYMYRRDESVGRDPSIVSKTCSFNLPIRRIRAGKRSGLYKIPAGSKIYTCFSSDYFHPDADEWREDAWNMIRERGDCEFFMITKRPERIANHLPYDWNGGDDWEHVTIAVTCENQGMADKRLPIYLPLALPHHAVMIEPMLTSVDLRPYFTAYPGAIELVLVGGESGSEARACDYDWVLDVHRQCKEHGASFHYHQTGARLIKGGREYHIPREMQHREARMAGLDL